MADNSLGRESRKPSTVVVPQSDEAVWMVLLVDDQPIVGETIRRMLADEADIDFHYCADPAEAIDAVKRIRPTVILQDLVMPELDGLTLVKMFRANERTRETPRIVL
jgi:PleD family two-component response regulator